MAGVIATMNIVRPIATSNCNKDPVTRKYTQPSKTYRCCPDLSVCREHNTDAIVNRAGSKDAGMRGLESHKNLASQKLVNPLRIGSWFFVCDCCPATLLQSKMLIGMYKPTHCPDSEVRGSIVAAIATETHLHTVGRIPTAI